jgi:hypothetical protein
MAQQKQQLSQSHKPTKDERYEASEIIHQIKESGDFNRSVLQDLGVKVQLSNA